MPDDPTAPDTDPAAPPQPGLSLVNLGVGILVAGILGAAAVSTLFGQVGPGGRDPSRPFANLDCPPGMTPLVGGGGDPECAGPPPEPIGVCHAEDGNPVSYTYVEVAPNGTDWAEHASHADDVLNVTGPQDCPAPSTSPTTTSPSPTSNTTSTPTTPTTTTPQPTTSAPTTTTTYVPPPTTTSAPPTTTSPPPSPTTTSASPSTPPPTTNLTTSTSAGNNTTAPPTFPSTPTTSPPASGPPPTDELLLLLPVVTPVLVLLARGRRRDGA